MGFLCLSNANAKKAINVHWSEMLKYQYGFCISRWYTAKLWWFATGCSKLQGKLYFRVSKVERYRLRHEAGPDSLYANGNDSSECWRTIIYLNIRDFFPLSKAANTNSLSVELYTSYIVAVCFPRDHERNCPVYPSFQWQKILCHLWHSTNLTSLFRCSYRGIWNFYKLPDNAISLKK